MRVVSWNLWWRHGPWQQRRPAIAAVLSEIGPDVCGLQEVWGGATENLAAELADRLGLHWCWASLPTASHRQAEHGQDIQIGNAVLSRWPILAQAELRLPVAEGEQPRVALYARLDAPGGPLPLFTTHLTHRPGASAERVAQVRALAGFVAEHGTGDAYPPVVTGDFNAEPDSDELRLIGGLSTAPAVPGLVLVDAWRYADPGDPGHSWDRRNGHLGERGLLDARIDYLLVGLPHGDRGRVRSAWLAGTAPVDGVWPSDHFAVVADLTSDGIDR
ncbi:MAG: endonuclease [Micromonosporaceae bacterium]|nr:endonuclease [Micromonosporaceae bacterium]